MFPLMGKTDIRLSHDGYIDLDVKLYYKHKGWEKVYVNHAVFFSDLGLKVLISTHKEVLEELERRKIDTLVIHPSRGLKDKWLKRAKDRKDRHWYLWLKENTEKFVEEEYDNAFNYIYDLVKDSKTLHGFIVDDMDVINSEELDLIIRDFGVEILPKESSKYKFMWGVSKERGETASLLTENLMEVVHDKELDVYYLTIDDDLIINNEVERIRYLVRQLANWYKENLFDYESETGKFILLMEDYQFTLEDLYYQKDLSFTEGETIYELLFKMDALFDVISKNSRKLVNI